MSNVGPVVAVAAALPLAVVLILQGTGAVDLTHPAKAVPRPSVRPQPIGTPTALADAPLKNGADGITMPAPVAMGTLTKAEVAQGYEHLKKLLVAAHLEPGTVFKGETKPYADLLAPHQRKQFLDGLKSTDFGTNTRSELTAFAPGSVEQAAPVQAGGTVEVAAGSAQSSAQGSVKLYQGVLVKIRYTFVYSITLPGSTTVEKVTSRREEDLFIAKPKAVEVWTGQWSNTIDGADCTAADGFLHPKTATSPGCSRTTRA
jgi:hypothetical protein